MLCYIYLRKKGVKKYIHISANLCRKKYRKNKLSTIEIRGWNWVERMRTWEQIKGSKRCTLNTLFCTVLT